MQKKKSAPPKNYYLGDLYNVCPNIGPKPVGRCHMSSRDSFASEAGPGDLGTLDKLVIRLVLAANAVMDRHSNPV